MKLRPTTYLGVTLAALLLLAFSITQSGAVSGLFAQEAEPVNSNDTPSSLEDEIELAEIRLAIKMQGIEVAKAERQVLTKGIESASTIRDAAEEKLKAIEQLSERNIQLYASSSISSSELQTTLARKLDARMQFESRNAEYTNLSANLAVHDAKSELLHLRVKLAIAQLNQLKRRRDR